MHAFCTRSNRIRRLRGEVDSEIYLLLKEVRDRGDPNESLDLVQTLLTIIDVLKKSARSSADEPEIAAEYSLNGPERREWEFLCAAPYPQGDEGCSDMKVNKVQQLARLVKDVQRLHRRFFSANDNTSLEESVQSRNKHIRERYSVIKVDYCPEAITLEEAKALWAAQGGRCSQCGELLWWSRLKGGALCFPELDRSDISKGSYARNSSWTCHFCNTKKGMTDDLKSYDRILLETLREGRKLLKSADNVEQVHDLLQAEVVRQASRQGFYKWAKQQKGGARRSTS